MKLHFALQQCCLIWKGNLLSDKWIIGSTIIQSLYSYSHTFRQLRASCCSFLTFLNFNNAYMPVLLYATCHFDIFLQCQFCYELSLLIYRHVIFTSNMYFVYFNAYEQPLVDGLFANLISRSAIFKWNKIFPLAHVTNLYFVVLTNKTFSYEAYFWEYQKLLKRMHGDAISP